jgi:translation elongation factor P/translation initiation factor 5A
MQLEIGREYILRKDYGSQGYMFIRQEGEDYVFMNLATYEEIIADEYFVMNLQLKLKNNFKTKLRKILRVWLEEEMIEEEDMRKALVILERI